MKYSLATSPWSHTGPDESDGTVTDEEDAVSAVLASKYTTMGDETEQYEEELCKAFKSKFAVTCNSGSSANLLMTAAQFFRTDGKNLKSGDEIIVPVLGWSTSYSPLQQYGLKLRFVDVSEKDLCINPNIVEEAITDKTRAILAVDLLGNPCDYLSLQEICETHGLLLLEDSCEAMGASIGKKYAGTFGECGTFSTFFSHHISTIEGGIVLTDNEELYHIMLSLRSHGWTRNQPENSKFYRKDKNSWEFVLPGYNIRPNEVTSAIGRVQLLKLPDFVNYRRANALYFEKLFKDMGDIQILKPRMWSSYFGFALILKNWLADEKAGLWKWFNECGVETRPIISGSFLQHPTIQYYNYTVYKDMLVGNNAHGRGLMIGNHNYNVTDGLDYVKDCLDKFTEKV